MKTLHWLLIWAPGTIFLIYIAGIDLFPVEQFLLLLFCSGLMIFVYSLERMKTDDSAQLSVPRLFFMVIAGFVSVHYFIWRIQFSIPWSEDPFSLFCSLALLFGELMGVTLSFMGMFINIHPLRREYTPISLDRDDLPDIDILIPTFDESATLLRSTMLAAGNIDYPRDKLHVYLLDDGGTDAKCQQQGVAGDLARRRKETLTALCIEADCCYLTREDNHDAKAGNINAALRAVSSDFLVVFDADHVPAVDFLEKTVGSIIDDEQVAIVQTPHFMLNRDPIEKNLQVEKHMPGEGEMFYTLNLRGMDNWDSGFFCGSGALIRRSALDEIGGVLSKTIVEDAETSLELISRGYKTKYLHRPLLVGLSAESISSFIVQRTRWATGMMQLLRYRNPLFVKGIGFGQRVGYFNTMFYWLFGLAHMIFILSPAMALLFGAILFAAPPVEIFLYVVPYLLSIHLSMHLYYGKVRWWLMSEVYETIQSFSLLLGPFVALISPSGKKFAVTPKEESSEHDSISSMSRNFYVLLFILILATIIGGYHLLHDEQGVEYFLVSLLWNSYNILFVLAALGALVETKQRRHRPRVAVDTVAQVIVREKMVPCNIEDMTEDGALLRLPSWLGPLEIEEGKLLFSDQNKAIEGCVTHVLGKLDRIPFRVTRLHPVDTDNEHYLQVGVQFQCEDIHQQRTLIAFVYGDSERWRKALKARNKPSTLRQGAALLGRSAWRGVLHLKKAFGLLRRREAVFQSEGKKL
ncbi:MAG: glycosyltransferase [Mariprofundaceae bacterium]|nr:glycosyltransferase [Mariprofundaceae bacterium]